MKQAAAAVLISVLLFLGACAAPASADTVQVTLFHPTPSPTQTQMQTSVAEPAKTPRPAEPEKEVVVRDGDTLEKDIIPQLCDVYALSEDQVKESLASAQSDMLIGENVEGFRRMEGILAPGRYQVKGEALEADMAVWIARAEKRYQQLADGQALNGLPPHEQLTLASVVEAECIGDAFEPQAAAVFLNRLDDGDKLRSCVTVEYALGYQRPYLTLDDLDVSSDYNTYQVRGLPPGPICAMDDESLAAAMAEPVDKALYYFFYDYAQNTMFFFEDYDTFKQQGKTSVALFKQTFDMDRFDIVDKRAVFSRIGK